MHKRKIRTRNNKRDQLAASIVANATKNFPATVYGKNPAAVLLGKLGGLKGGKARAKALTPERRMEIALAASKARWGRK
jgi:hypothetical protein